MVLTPSHAKCYAADVTRRAASGMDGLATVLLDAAVDLNPREMEAALLAPQRPLAKGVLFTDEVGLGNAVHHPRGRRIAARGNHD